MVGRVFSQNAATFSRMNWTETLAVRWAAVRNKPTEMQPLFDQAKIKYTARDAVRDAIERLRTDNGDFGSHDLRYCNAIIVKARASLSAEALQNPAFRVALQEAAWRESAGKGKLSILLCKRTGSIDGTKDLNLDFRRLAKAGEWEKLEMATELADLLDAIKKCPTTGGKIPYKDAERILGSHYKEVLALKSDTPPDSFQRHVDLAATAFNDAFSLFLSDKKSFADLIGRRLTELARPDPWELARASAEKLKTKGANFINSEFLTFVRSNFQLLSSEKFWRSKLVNMSYRPCFSVATSMAALCDLKLKLDKKIRIEKADIKSVLQTVKVPRQEPELDFNQSKDLEVTDKDLDISVDLTQPNDDVFTSLCTQVAEHYIASDSVNIPERTRAMLRRALEEAAVGNLSKGFTEVERGESLSSGKKIAQQTFLVMNLVFEEVLHNAEFGKRNLLSSIQDARNVASGGISNFVEG